MNSFVFANPTKVYFGRGSICHLAEAIAAAAGEKASVLLVYGGGSIKKSGLYDAVLAGIAAADGSVTELSGVEPNPRLASVCRGVELCREKKINCIIGAGGGSALDCAKAISVVTATGGDAWEIVKDSSRITGRIPVIAIPTLTATGSETDGYAVISNPETREKVGIGSDYARPVAAIMDPEYTYSVNAWQTGAGAADVFSHVLEVYFDRNSGAYVKNRMCEAVMKTVIQYAGRAIRHPDQYEARSNLMWAASVAINGELSLGNGSTAWSCHGMEHPLSGVYDITHGAGLAVLTPGWMRYVLNRDTVDKFAEYAVRVWDLPASMEAHRLANFGIERTESFFRSIGMPGTLRELGIPDQSQFEKMAEDGVRYGNLGNAYVPLTKEDVVNIYRSVF